MFVYTPEDWRRMNETLEIAKRYQKQLTEKMENIHKAMAEYLTLVYKISEKTEEKQLDQIDRIFVLRFAYYKLIEELNGDLHCKDVIKLIEEGEK